MAEWYLIQTAPIQEMRVGDALKEMKLDAYVPVERVWRRTARTKYVHERPLIRGYVFVRLPAGEVHRVHVVPGVQRLVRFDDRLATIDPEFIDRLKAEEADGEFDHCACAPQDFEVGARVRVTSGPYAGYVGAIAKLKGDRRVQLLLTLARGGGWAVTAKQDDLEVVTETADTAEDVGLAA